MGYSNYIHQKRSFTDKEWKQVLQEYDYLKEIGNIKPVNPENKDTIIFNGKNNSCESFYLEKNLENYFKGSMGEYYKKQFDKKKYHFNCCKTRMWEYDLSVWYMYVALNHISKDNITIWRDR